MIKKQIEIDFKREKEKFKSIFLFWFIINHLIETINNCNYGNSL